MRPIRNHRNCQAEGGEGTVARRRRGLGLLGREGLDGVDTERGRGAALLLLGRAK